VTLALVGVGDISPRYLKQAPISKRAQFVAACGHRLDSAKRRAQEYGIPAWYDDYTAMYEREKPDGVVICTPNSLHTAPVIAAFERGIHVLCEKPMATNWEDCQAMVAVAQKSGAVFLAMPFNGTPESNAPLIEHVNQPKLGVFLGAEANVLFPGPGRDNWYYDRKVAGGAMLDSMVYPVSSLINILGPARRVTAFVNTLIPHRLVSGGTMDVTPPHQSAKSVESNVDDNISLVLEWPGGQQAVLRTLWGTSFLNFDTAIYGRQGSVFMGGDGTIVHSPGRAIVDAETLTWRGITDCYRIPAYKPKDPQNEGLIDHFVDCIQGVRQPTSGGQQQLHVHEILFKAYEAARSGVAQELETTFTPWHTIDPSFHDTRSRPL
jgi:predicted dehydrogenase